MAAYTYRAVNASGGVETGTMDARSKSEAYETLTAKKLRPIRIERSEDSGEARSARGKSDGGSSSKASTGDAVSGLKRLNAQGVLLFTEELAELLEAGLQLEPALKVIESRQDNPPVKMVAAHVRQQIREGRSFSNALRSCQKSFSDLYCNMAAAGEAAGALPKILRKQVDYLTTINELQRRVTMALVYPTIVFAAGILLLVIFMTFLLPQLTVLLSKSGQQLPFMTRMLIATSGFVGGYWWLILLTIAGVVFGFRSWTRTPSGEFTWHRVQLRIPLVGPILASKFFTQFLQTLATLVNNGVTLLNGLVLMQQATPNVYLKAILGQLAERIGEGVSLSRSMRQATIFPPVLIDIISVGEQTGDLGNSLQRGATRYDREFNGTIEKLTAFIQPLTIVMVAVFVGIVAYSMITGILTSVSGLRLR